MHTHIATEVGGYLYIYITLKIMIVRYYTYYEHEYIILS